MTTTTTATLVTLLMMLITMTMTVTVLIISTIMITMTITITIIIIIAIATVMGVTVTVGRRGSVLVGLYRCSRSRDLDAILAQESIIERECLGHGGTTRILEKGKSRRLLPIATYSVMVQEATVAKELTQLILGQL